MAQASEGALGKLGITPWPIGTPDELIAEGLDPERVASCAPSRPGVMRGCPVWKQCRFNLPRMGGFKGKGPQYIGYSLTTHEGDRKQDSMMCHAFTRTMQDRMDASVMARQQGRPHETIRIVAQEGQPIQTRIGKKSDALDASDPRYRDKNEDGSFKWFYETKTVSVPAHPRPGTDERLTYDQELAAQDREAQAREDAMDAASYAAPQPNGTDEIDTFEKITKRRGRPTNAEIAARKASAEPDPEDDGLGVA